MANLILPSSFTRQPQYPANIDGGNPLTRGLIFVGNGATPGVSAIRNQAITRQAGATTASSPQGMGFYAPTVTSLDRFTLPDLTGLINTGSGGTGEASMILITSGGSTANQGFVEVGYGTTASHYPFGGLVYLTTFDNNRWVNGATPVVSLALPHVVGIQFKNGTQRWSQNGLTAGTGTRAVTASVANTNCIGRSIYNNSSEDVRHKQSVPLILIWNRYLSDAEVTALSKTLSSPWQVFQMPARRFWPQDSAAPGGLFVNPLSGRGGGAAQPLRWAA